MQGRWDSSRRAVSFEIRVPASEDTFVEEKAETPTQFRSYVTGQVLQEFLGYASKSKNRNYVVGTVMSIVRQDAKLVAVVRYLVKK